MVRNHKSDNKIGRLRCQAEYQQFSVSHFSYKLRREKSSGEAFLLASVNRKKSLKRGIGKTEIQTTNETRVAEQFILLISDL